MNMADHGVTVAVYHRMPSVMDDVVNGFAPAFRDSPDLRFQDVHNEQIIAYSKSSADQSNEVKVRTEHDFDYYL